MFHQLNDIKPFALFISQTTKYKIFFNPFKQIFEIFLH